MAHQAGVGKGVSPRTGHDSLRDGAGWPQPMVVFLFCLVSCALDSKGVLRRATERAYTDSKTEYLPPLGNQAPRLEALQQIAHTSRRSAFRLATASAVDGAMLQHMGIHEQCSCGQAAPARHHLVFNCSAALWEHARKSMAEKRTLCPLLPLPAPLSMHIPELDDEFVSLLLRARTSAPLVAY